jgi:hypothetical protein
VFVPVVGPFAALLQQEVTCGGPVLEASTTQECSEEIVTGARSATVLLVDGLVQTAGAALFLVGWGTNTRQLVLERPVVVPAKMGHNAYGLSVSGSF